MGVIDGMAMAALVGLQTGFVDASATSVARYPLFVALHVGKSKIALKELGRALSSIERLPLSPPTKTSVTGSRTLHGPWSKSRIYGARQDSAHTGLQEGSNNRLKTLS